MKIFLLETHNYVLTKKSSYSEYHRILSRNVSSVCNLFVPREFITTTHFIITFLVSFLLLKEVNRNMKAKFVYSLILIPVMQVLTSEEKFQLQKHLYRKPKVKQAGAELCQAQIKLEDVVEVKVAACHY